jgi:predicted TIM-barrel fold metal-dependent hydrolase
VGAEKILYGSDYPLLLYPRKIRTPNFTTLLGQINNSGLGQPELDLVLGANMQKLLKLT